MWPTRVLAARLKSRLLVIERKTPMTRRTQREGLGVNLGKTLTAGIAYGIPVCVSSPQWRFYGATVYAGGVGG